MAARITLRDIAEEVGVSISSVSRVLSGSPCRISEEKRAAIIEIAKRWNYLPNQIARSLVSGRSRSFGLIIPNIESRTYTTLTKCFEEMCRAKGYGIFTANSNDDPEMDMALVNLLVERGVDAIFIVPSNMAKDNQALIDRLVALPIPFVMVARFLVNFNCDRVYFDNELGGVLATRHLIEKGHSRIACVANTSTSNTGKARFRGYVRAMQDAGLQLEDGLVLSAEYNMRSGYAAGKKLLERGVDAVFAGSDYIALGIRKAYGEAGLYVPQDLSIVTFDRSESDFLFDPPMTAIVQDMETLAYHALSIVSRRLEGHRGDPCEMVLPPELVPGGSVLDKTHATSAGTRA